MITPPIFPQKKKNDGVNNASDEKNIIRQQEESNVKLK